MVCFVKPISVLRSKISYKECIIKNKLKLKEKVYSLKNMVKNLSLNSVKSGLSVIHTLSSSILSG